MKKLISLFVIALMAVVVFNSCNKKDIYDPRSDVKVIAGEFVPQDGDITFLKSAPTVGGHQINCYDKKVGSPTVWSVVNGTEFLPGSAPALDWASYVIDSPTWWFSGGVYITYCPVLPMRVVIKATQGGYSTTPSYLGIWDGTPSQASFPIHVQDRRLGDKLTLNANALKALPGYTNLSFTVSYDKSVIDVNGTATTSGNTDAGWPTYVYSSTVNVANQVVTGTDDMTVYDGLDSKITGNIVITIHVDATTIVLTGIPASSLGHGMAITLLTTKVGWYNSGVITITENDITPTVVTVTI